MTIELDSRDEAEDPLDLGLRAGYGPVPARKVSPTDGRFGRFHVLGEIGRGGLGVVLRGHDPDLGREVALKVLHERHGDSVAMGRRLLEEARIAGGLQHPGIVPVYEIGPSESRPYFAMRLVAGQTLAALLRARTSPEADRQRFLTMFEQVCQTVAYAHSRRVIHRDLKPSNVMVGAFGEVQVVDWGLAKALGAPAAEGPSCEAPLPRSDGPQSQTGTVVGTWDYMPPEQARGELDKVDARADVFALGSILCEILTGEPAYVAATAEEVRAQARAGELDAALRRLQEGVEPALADLARRCLAADRDDRPADASAVGRVVGEHLASVAERARRAELDTTHARAAAAEDRARALEAESKVGEERAKRRRVLGTCGVVFAAAAVACGVYAWRSAERSGRLERTSRSVSEALDRAVVLRGEAKSGDLLKWEGALAALREAQSIARTGETDASSGSRLAALGAEIGAEANAARATAERVKRESAFVARLEEIRIETGEEVFDNQRYGYGRADENYRAAFAQHGLDPRLDPRSAAQWIAASDIKDSLIQALDDWALTAKQAHSAAGKEMSRRECGLLLEAARLADHDPLRNRIRDAWEAKAKDVLDTIASSAEIESCPKLTRHVLYTALRAFNDLEGAERILRMTHVDEPSTFLVLFDLTRLQRVRSPGRLEEAIRFATAALAVRPTCWRLWLELALMLADQGRLPQALDLGHRISVQQPASHWGHTILGTVLLSGRDPEQAIVHLRRALELEPRSWNARMPLIRALLVCSRNEDAILECRIAVQQDPLHPGTHSILGLALVTSGDYDGALEALDRALALDDHYDVAWAFKAWCLVQRQQYEMALEITADGLARLAIDSGPVRSVRGIALAKLGRHAEAVAELRAAIVRSPRNPEWHRELAKSLWSLQDWEGAARALRRAIEIEPRNAKARAELGDVLLHIGDAKGAQEQLVEALRLNPNEPGVHRRLGEVFRELRELNRAIREFKLAIEQDPNDWPARVRLGTAFSDRGQHELAIRTLEAAVRVAGDQGEAHRMLAEGLTKAGRVSEARAEVDRALALDPDDPKARSLSGTVHLMGGNLIAGIEDCQLAARMDAKNHVPWQNLGYGLADVLDQAGSLRAFEEAFRRAPQDPGTQYGYAAALSLQGRAKEAAAVLGDVPPPTEAHRNLRAICQRMLALEARLPAILAGADRLSDVDDHLLTAWLCEAKGLYAQAVDHYAAAFRGASTLAARRNGWPRYRAAVAAARCRDMNACLAWLSEELDLVAQDDRPPVRRRILEQWKRELALSAVRDEPSVSELPESVREGFRRLWQRVEAAAGSG